jgi:hypothetical protein
MCIYMHVGDTDTGWVNPMLQQASTFRAKGYKARFTIERNEGHVIGALVGPGSARLFAEIDESRRECP